MLPVWRSEGDTPGILAVKSSGMDAFVPVGDGEQRLMKTGDGVLV